MQMMSQETDKIKDKVDIVEFLRSYLDLKPAGRNLRAICPFHQEKTPSFIVSPERKMWRCFGACGEGGDIFKFLMKYENIEFHEALKILAEKAGVPLRELNPREQKEFGILYDINESAADFFKQELKQQKEVLNYLRDRGLNEETIEEFELGFSPGGEKLVLALLKLGHDITDIVRAGLAYKNSYNLYRDKFDQRIIFPICNPFGKVVAFTGRIMPNLEKTLKDAPKYVNSPETAIFNKSKVLYGFHKSKNEIAKSRTAFLVEGQMDFLMTWQCGIKNVIAVSGTGLTTYHLEKLRRLADAVIISFDNDDAGIKAMERSLTLFGNFDFYVKMIELGNFKDPADACKTEPNFLSQAIQKAKPAFEKLFQIYFSSANIDIAEKKRLIYYFLSKIQQLKSPTEQSIWLKELARFSGIPEITLIKELEMLPKKTENTPSEPNFRAPFSDKMEKIEIISKRLICVALMHRNFLERLKNYTELMPVGYQNIMKNPENNLVFELEMQASYEFSSRDQSLIEKEFNELLHYLQIECLKKKQRELRQFVTQEQEIDNNEEKTSQIMQEFCVITKKLEDLKNVGIKPCG